MVAAVVVPSEGTDGSSELSEGGRHCARTAKIDGGEQEIVNISAYNVWLPSRLTGHRRRKFIIAVLDTAAEICMMSEGIVVC